MSHTVAYLVPKSWTAGMSKAAFDLAETMTEDREKRAYIVGLLHIAWPTLIDAAIADRFSLSHEEE